MESLDDLKAPVRMSMIESDREGPPMSAPGSIEPGWRASDPRTRIVVGEKRGTPPPVSADLAASEVDFAWICAEMRNRASDSSSHPATAARTHLTTRPGVIDPEPPRGSRGRGSRRRRCVVYCGFAPGWRGAWGASSRSSCSPSSTRSSRPPNSFGRER